MTFTTGDNNFGMPGTWLVHPTAGLGTHTTLTAALATASAGDTIYLAAGHTYSESPTISKVVQISGLQQTGFGSTGPLAATISGTLTFSAGGAFLTNLNISGSITNSAGLNATTFINCCILTGIGTAISITAGITSTLQFYNCIFQATGSVKAFNFTTAGSLTFNYCNFISGSLGTYSTASTLSSSAAAIFSFCNLDTVITTSGTSSITIENCRYDNLGNLLFLTCGGTGANLITNSYINSGSAAAISIGVGSALTISNTVINSTNANPITGLGTLNYTNIDQISGSPGTYNTSTINGRETDIGTLKLVNPLGVTFGGTGLNTTTANNILFSSATNTISQIAAGANGVLVTSNTSIPSILANGSPGQVLTANSAAAPSWQSPGSNANQIVSIFDDFIGSDTAPATEVRGQQIWQVVSSTWGQVTNTFSGHPGVITNIAFASTDCAIMLINRQNISTPGVNALQIIPGGGQIVVTWIFNIVTLSTGTNRYILRFGLGDTVNGDNTNGCYFEYSDNINSGNWNFKTASASSITTSNSSTLVTTGWHNAQLTINAAASSVAFTVDGVSLGTPISTNIPTAATSPYFDINRTAGTIAAGSVVVDLFSLTQNLTTAR